jgi:hypothetical protein
MTWPEVLTDDYGIRPAGAPDECFYCRSKVGELHSPECTVIVKKIEMLVLATLPDKTVHYGRWARDVPHHWNQDMCEFSVNQGTWCADNLLREHNRRNVTWDSDAAWKGLEAVGPVKCLCGVLKFQLSKIVDAAPRRPGENEK